MPGLVHWLRLSWTRVFSAYRSIVLESGLPGAARHPLLFSALVLRQVWQKEVSLRATALSFQLFFSLVPALTLFLSLLAALPGLADTRDRLVGFIVKELFPANREMIQEQIASFVANAEVFSLVGIVFVIYGAFTMTLTLDRAINAIWNLRPVEVAWHRRLGSLGLVAAVFLGGIAASLSLSDPFQRVFDLADGASLITPGLRSLLSGVFFEICALGVVYKLVPRTYVHNGSVVIATVLAALAFSLAKTGFFAYANWTSTYTEVYGVLGALFIALLWVYLAWFIVLFGAVIAFVLQNYDTLAGQEREAFEGERCRVFHAVRLLVLVHRSYAERGAPIAISSLAEELELAVYQADQVADQLAEAGLLAQSGAARWEQVAPTLPAEQITLARVARAVANDALQLPERADVSSPELARILQEASGLLDARLAETSVAELLGGRTTGAS